MQITGNTAVLPLFDLVQMLSVNEATGMLKVENQSERGYLYLQQGKVINALDGNHKDGEDAAKRVFALRDARFSFSAELPSVAEPPSMTNALVTAVTRPPVVKDPPATLSCVLAPRLTALLPMASDEPGRSRSAPPLTVNWPVSDDGMVNASGPAPSFVSP